MGEWINFKELRSRLSFAAVLEHYDVELQVKGDQAQGYCPLPTHSGQRRSASFSANLARGIWQCFGCGASGNVLDFAVRMEGKDPGNTGEFRAVALGLQEWLGLKGKRPEKAAETPGQPARLVESRPSDKSEAAQPRRDQVSSAQEVRINAPLDFSLQGLQPEHPYLLSRGFTPQTIWRFGLGFCSRGLMAGRIAIPLYDLEDRLVGYAGRLVDDSRASAENPKYRFPARRDHQGVVHEFRKSHLLYGANRIQAPVDHLVVVEGFPSVWWLDQAGISNVVAVMGSACSREQAAIILAKTTDAARITILPDGDEAGKRFCLSVFEAVAGKRWVRWVPLEPNRQPTNLRSEVLKQLLAV